MKIPIFSQNSSKICIFKILINYKKKSNGQKKKILHFLILLDLFYDCANFRVNRSISCRDLRGGQISPPPPPQLLKEVKEVNKRGRHAYNLHGWTCLPSGIVMEIHCHITGILRLLWGWGCHLVVQCNLFMIFQSTVIRVCYQNKFPNF